MVKKIVLLFVFVFFGFASRAMAISDPLFSPNNPFGIHIHNENDLEDAVKLVNGNGGDWGYVTFVITEAERDKTRWQNAFDQMRRMHLIPIVRIATKPQGEIWEAPKHEEINNWIAFLNSLNWVTENRYVVISNEPNHAKEWGGKISPEEYAIYLKEFSVKLKEADSGYYVLPAGLDASARTTKSTLEESVFIKRMIKEVPDIVDYIDGWNSHSYPNPAFFGSETDTGKGTIRTFEWELNYLKSLGVSKELPVFITETGWSLESLSEDDISGKYMYAFEKVWTDPKIVAITPFILNYPEPPFAQFSWKKTDGSFYRFYDTLTNFPKTKGSPKQIFKGKIFGTFVNPVEIAGASVNGVLLAQNLGQSIWVMDNVKVEDESRTIKIVSSLDEAIEPRQIRVISFSFTAPEKPGIYKIPFVLTSKEKNISPSYPFDIGILEKLNEAPEVKKMSLFDTIIARLKIIKGLIMAKMGP